jgi:hypothetical protein
MILKAVPQFASSVLTGSVSGLDGGAVKAAAMAGYGLGTTVWQMSRTAAQSVIGGASVVSQAAQTYQYTAQASRDTGSTDGQAKAAGAKEAAATVMTGSQPGGPRAAGERIYSDYQRGQQFSDVRNTGGASNTMASPVSAGATASATVAANTAHAAQDSWGSYASDKKKKEGK